MRAAWAVWFVCTITMLSCGIARGDEAMIVDTSWKSTNVALYSFRTNGVEDCRITPELKVEGEHRMACVALLDQATRLARAEMRVNEPKRRGKR